MEVFRLEEHYYQEWHLPEGSSHVSRGKQGGGATVAERIGGGEGKGPRAVRGDELKLHLTPVK